MPLLRLVRARALPPYMSASHGHGGLAGLAAAARAREETRTRSCTRPDEAPGLRLAHPLAPGNASCCPAYVAVLDLFGALSHDNRTAA